MLKGFLCLPLLAVLMTGAAASDEQLPELRIQIVAGGGASAEYSASIERLQDRRSIRSEGLPPMVFGGSAMFPMANTD